MSNTFIYALIFIVILTAPFIQAQIEPYYNETNFPDREEPITEIELESP